MSASSFATSAPFSASVSLRPRSSSFDAIELATRSSKVSAGALLRAAAFGGGGGAAARGGGATQQRCSLEELRQMKVGELKRRLRERGITDPDAVEKEELVQLLFGLQESEGSAQ